MVPVNARWVGTRRLFTITRAFILVAGLMMIPAVNTVAIAETLTAKLVSEDLSAVEAAGWDAIAAQDYQTSSNPALGGHGAVDDPKPVVSVKGAHDGSNIFLRFEWPDSTQTDQGRVWTYSGSSWSKGGNEDRLYVMWPQVDGPGRLNQPFAQAGCRTSCHLVDGSGNIIPNTTAVSDDCSVCHTNAPGDVAGRDPVFQHAGPTSIAGVGDCSTCHGGVDYDPINESGADMVAPSGTSFDLWHWKAQRSAPIALAEDQFTADGQRRSRDGGNLAPDNDDGGVPQYVWVSGSTAVDNTGPILQSQVTSLVASDQLATWNAGNEQYELSDGTPVSVPEGTRVTRHILQDAATDGSTDVKSDSVYESGTWKVVLTRTLDTDESATGTVADKDYSLDSSGTNYFSFAVTNNSGINHAGFELESLVFEAAQEDTPTPTPTDGVIITPTPTPTSGIIIPTETPLPSGPESADLDGDGDVDANDLILFQQQWHSELGEIERPEAPTATPTNTPLPDGNHAPVAVIDLDSVSPQKIEELGITTGLATGMPVVPVDTTVYLLGSGADAEGSAMTAYEWSVHGPRVNLVTSSKDFVFRPLQEGVYEVSLVVTDASEAVSDPAIRQIVAAKWAGIRNCSSCHDGSFAGLADKHTGWQETDHASFFSHAIDGQVSSHYSSDCISCHTVGYDTMADNHGFDDVASALGWIFPATLEAGNWTDMQGNYPELANLANIQCENCHGPGSMHNGNSDRIGTSLDAGLCGTCHDDLTHHTKNYEWDTSNHANPTTYPTGEGRESCVPCHSGQAFVQTWDSDYAHVPISTEATAIGCAVCHDPHSGEHEHQVRQVADATLGNDVVVTAEEAGVGIHCMHCHKSRRNVNEYVQEYHGHFGPHHGPQADMIKGTGGYEWAAEGESIQVNFKPHLELTENTCARCHMADPPEGAASRAVGGHTFRVFAAAGSVEGVTEDVSNLNACVECHSTLTTFNRVARADYDGDGTTEGIQDEIQGLLHVLGDQLPPLGSPQVDVEESYTGPQLKAAYNYFFIEEDKSKGIHNAEYAIKLLQASYRQLAGEDVPNAVIR